MPIDGPDTTVQRGFTGGEIAPVLHARADSPRYVDGLRTCRNFMVLKHGAAANRPGYRFVGECKTSSSNVRLRKFVHSTPGESILVEIGSGYLRFYKNGALIELSGAATAWSAVTQYEIGDLVSQGGVNYYAKAPSLNQSPPNATFWHPLDGLIFEVPTTYTTDGLIGGWEQSGDVVTITHRLHDPRELVYVSDTHWILREALTEPTTVPPANLVLNAGAAGSVRVAYVITAAGLDTFEESLVSNVASDSATAPATEAAPNELTWDQPTDDVEEYYIYKDVGENGVFGFIGTAKPTPGAEVFRDTGLIPDYTITPPLDRTPFVSADTRPHVAAHYQQRRFYGGSNAQKDGINASRTGFFNNFCISSPIQDDDALAFRMVGKQQHAIRHMLGLGRLTVFTDGGIWGVGEPQKPLTPSSLGASQETYAGVAPDVPPVAVGSSVLYVQQSGSILRDVAFDQQVEGLNGRDLTLFAAHLVEGYSIDSMDYAETPNSIIWCVRSDGTLLGLTYIRELDVFGWHRHDTSGGSFEQVCTVPAEDGEDGVYVIVERGGARYIERMATRFIRTGFFNLDSFFVDSGLSYDGAPATVFSGLDHLEGETVVALADGDPVLDATTGDMRGFTVTGGSVTLPAAASRVHIGLPIEADLETLNLDVQGSAVRDKKKRVGSVTLIVDKSSRGFESGPDTSNLIPYELAGGETAADEFTGHVEVQLGTTWNEHGRVFVRQSQPLPITILGILPNTLTEG